MDYKKYRLVNARTAIFMILNYLVLWISSDPLVFGQIGNRIYPLVLGIPLAIAWPVLMTVVMVLMLAAEYFLQNKHGELDFDVDPDYDYLNDISVLESK